MTFEFKEKFKAAISATLEHRRLTAFYPIHTCDQGHRCVHITKVELLQWDTKLLPRAGSIIT